jgi:amidase
MTCRREAIARRALAVALLAGVLAVGCSAPDPFEVTEADIDEIQDALRQQRTTCAAVVSAYLARIEAYDQPLGLNAISMVHPGALDVARGIDRRLAAGEPLGKLFCVPVLVKDNFDTYDLITTAGSIALKDSVPPDDAFMVRRLREADAIVLAKTNMAEWAFSPRQTRSSTRGVTANAYALDRVPAGSSGGTASGVAASFGAVGLGSDTGNSIRGPASHLALFGIRSTLGLTSRDGVVPLVLDRDVAGPLTRTVADGARVLNVVAGYDPADPITELGRDRRAADYTAFLDADGLRGARIGVLRALADPDEGDPAVLALFERALETLAAAGADLVDPLVIDHLAGHLEAANFCPRFRYDVHRYLRSLGEAAPFLDVNAVYEQGQHSDYIGDRLAFFADYPLDVPPPLWDPPCPEYPDHPGRRAYLDDVVAAMDAADVEVLVYPTWTHPPARLSHAQEEYRGDNSQLVAPATGMPAASVPMGFVAGELPTGLQILARPYDEAIIFRIAYAYEQRTHHRKPPTAFPPL